MPERLLLRVEEAAERLNVSRSLCYQLVLSGEIQSIKLGRSRRVPLIELERYIQRRIEEVAPGAA